MYDNNNINGEYFDNIVFDYIKQGFIKIKNWRGIKSPQMMIYHDCYNNYYDKYDWLLFNDIDEYLYSKIIIILKSFYINENLKNAKIFN